MRALGYFPNIDSPKSFNEKTNWYKLYYQDDLITKCIDKYLFKEHVGDIIGYDSVVPLLGVWDNAREIDFDKLPQQFVLKSNWGSGSRHILIVKDKSKLNLDQVRFKLNNWIQPWENVYYHTFDWGYKNIKPKIIAEEFVADKINEYRFFCFNGLPAYFSVINDSAPGQRTYRNYYDMDWNLLPLTIGVGNSDLPIKKPDNFDEMVSICKTLSKPFPHVRVDLCQTKNGLLVEELTFYTGSGTSHYPSIEWDNKFGEPFILPEKRIIAGEDLSRNDDLKVVV